MEGGLNDLVASAKGELSGAKSLAHDGFKSKAYLYPLKGWWFFIMHPDLWRPMWLRVGPSIWVSFLVTIWMFFFTYIPQCFVFGIFNGPLALVNVYFLVLSESAAISAAITKTVFEQGLDDTFDQTLIEAGSGDLVANGRPLVKHGNLFKKGWQKVKAPWHKFAPANVISYLMFLPLNFIPIIGTAVFIYLQGKKYGLVMHNRYYKLKGLPQSEADININRMRGAYTAFGIPATMLEHLTPFTGIFFAYTNMVGAALWAHDLEHGTAADQEMIEFKEKSERFAKDLVGHMQNNPDVQIQMHNVVTKGVQDFQRQFKSLPAVHIAGELVACIKAQLDESAAGQVAENFEEADRGAGSWVGKGLWTSRTSID